MMDWIPIPQYWLQVWGWTVIHSLWQGTLIALLLVMALHCLRDESARLRYNLVVAALFIFLLCLVATFLSILGLPVNSPASLVPASSSGPRPLPMSLIFHLGSNPTLLLTMVGFFWLVGVMIMSTRTMAGLYLIFTLRHRGISPPPDEWQTRIMDWFESWNVHRKIQVYVSERVHSPVVLGFFHQSLYLPLSFLTGFPPEHVKVILAHEVAHFLRRDALINFLQAFMEIMLFYHPAIWWISRRLREEREYCCDDYAIEKCGQPMMMARALMDLQKLKENSFMAAPQLSATGSLRSRIERLFKTKEKTMDLGQKLLAVLFVLSIGMVALPLQSISKNIFSLEAGLQDDKQKSSENIKVKVKVEGDDEKTFTITTLDSVKEDSHKVMLFEGEQGHKYVIKIKDGKTFSVTNDSKEIRKEDLEKLDVDLDEVHWHSKDGETITIEPADGDSCEKTIVVKIAHKDKETDLSHDCKVDKKVKVIREYDGPPKKIGEEIKSELIKDGLFPGKNKTLEFRLSKEGLFINDVKQPVERQKKYEHLLQETMELKEANDMEIKLKFKNE